MGENMTDSRSRMRDLSCVVVIPTYNNEKTIEKVVDDVLQYTADVIVVNDGSTDNTAQILSGREDIDIVHLKKNQGKGVALQEGFRRAISKGFRYAITIDSDGQHYPEEMLHFLDYIEDNPDSLIVGARNLNAENMPEKNSFANKFSNFWLFVETGKQLSDTQSGFRLYPVERLNGIRWFTRRYEFELEVLVRSIWRGIEVVNLPIKVFYPPKEERVSHFRPARDFFRISVVNMILVLVALLIVYPIRFIKGLTLKNAKQFIKDNITNTSESNLRLSLAISWGVFCGIIPFWGYQMIFAALSSHFLKLNKFIAVASSNISVPPMIPFILYGSFYFGSTITGMSFTFDKSILSIEILPDYLYLYLIGSFTLAMVCALLSLLISWLLLTLFRRKVNDQ
ncbi:MAG TPA: DUF2062 domain-containing protein [Bacteroidales bacterium]|nr:DUF2062 domain-containing protein [Bacteroidales bacterium]